MAVRKSLTYTKAEAVELFKTTVAPVVIAEYGKDDKVAMRTAFNDFVDMLQKSDVITEYQSNRWTNPYK